MPTILARADTAAVAKLSKRNTAFNEDKLLELLGGPNVVVASGTVIKQDPPPGTPIPRGGGVTLTVARTRDFPMNIILGADIAFEKRKIGDVYDDLVKVNPASVLQIFEDVDDYTHLTESQRQEVDRALEHIGVSGPSGYIGAQGALALGGLG